MKIILTLCLLPALCFSQIQWESNFGGTAVEVGQKIIPAEADTHLLIGFTNSSDQDIANNSGQYDAWACLIDNSGQLLWEKTIGGTANDQFADGVAHPGGGWLLVGKSSSDDMDINDDTDSEQGLLCHLSSEGILQWCKTFGLDEDDEFTSITQRANGNFLISGATDNEDLFFTKNSLHSNQDYWLLEVDEDGLLLWERKYGGSDWEQALCHAEDEQGNIYLSGFSFSSDGDISQSYGSEDIWLVKTNSTGELLWQKNYGGSLQDQARSMLFYDSSIYLTGRSLSSNNTFEGYNMGQEDAFILKINSLNGQLEAQNNYGGALGDRFNQILLHEGNLLLTGYTRSQLDGLDPKGMADFWLVRVESSDLSPIWMKNFGGTNEDIAQDLFITTDQKTILLGSSYSSDIDLDENQGLADLWVMQTDILSSSNTPHLHPQKNTINYQITDGNIFLKNLPDEMLICQYFDLNGSLIRESTFTPANGEKDLSLPQESIFFLNIAYLNNGQQIFVLKIGGL